MGEQLGGGKYEIATGTLFKIWNSKALARKAVSSTVMLALRSSGIFFICYCYAQE